MRASHIALLSLVASTAAPVFAAPISHLNARSKDGGAALSARDHGCTDSTKGTSGKHKPQSQDGSSDGIFAGVGSSSKDSASDKNVPRDVTPESLAARVTTDDLLSALLSSRDSNHGEGFANVLNALASSRRDVASDELAARDDREDLAKILNTRSDTVDGSLDAREPSLQQETQARGIPDDPTKTVARDGSATNSFVDALLHSRDSPKSLTLDDVLSLASLGSRAFNELD